MPMAIPRPLAKRQTGNGPNVQYVKPALAKRLAEYQRIKDCISGADAVKAAGDKYLPRPNADDKSKENLARYSAYIARAVFYAVAGRSVAALIGQIFMRDPQKKMPDNFSIIDTDANGAGVSLDQLAKEMCVNTLTLGRCGCLVDYTTRAEGSTVADVASGDARAVIYAYDATQVLNWREARRGSKVVYTLVVIREEYERADDGFEAVLNVQHRVLRLITAEDAVNRKASDLQYVDAVNRLVSAPTDVYVIEIWRAVDPDNRYSEWGAQEVYYPLDANGDFLHEIPFRFGGVRKNDSHVDDPPMGPMVEVNLGHYRNSADNEESAYILGQPTPYVAGVDEEWAKNVLGGQIRLGSRALIPLPAGGTAGLLQPEPNTLAEKAMLHKERQMAALGAKLVEQREVQRTATESEQDTDADNSILANIARNVADLTLWALKTACVFTGDDPSGIVYKLNDKFDLVRLGADARQQVLLEYQSDIITFDEARDALRLAGVVTEDNDAALKKIDAQRQKKTDEALALAAAQAIAVKPKVPGGGPPPPGSSGNSPGNTPLPGAKPGSSNSN